MSVPSISKDSVNELRANFLKELAVKGNDSVHPKDLERVKKDDHWIERFLLHHKGDVGLALGMLWTSLEWRKANNLNELKESDLDMNVLCSGVFFPLEADTDGCTLLVFKCSKHIKGSIPQDNIQKCINYWFERIERFLSQHKFIKSLIEYYQLNFTLLNKYLHT